MERISIRKNPSRVIGEELIVGDGYGVVIGHGSQVVGPMGITAELQVLGTGNDDSSVLIANFNTSNANTPRLLLLKSGNATIGSGTAVVDTERLGDIVWGGADGTDLQTVGAAIRALVDGTPAANRVPGAITFMTAAGSADDDLAEKARITASGDLLIANGGGIVIGHTAQAPLNGTTFEAQILGTALADAGLGLARFSANTGGTTLIGGKSRNATIGLFTVVQDNDTLLRIDAAADDGTDMNTLATRVVFEVDDASPAANAVGGAIVLYTSTTGGTLTEAARINSSQDLLVADGGGLIVGHTSQLTVSGIEPEVQVLGTLEADSTILVAQFRDCTSSKQVGQNGSL